MTSCQVLWDKVLTVIKESTSPSIFQSFFSVVHPILFEDDRFILEVDSPLVADWLKQRYESVIISILVRECGRPVKLIIQSDIHAVLPAVPEEAPPVVQPSVPQSMYKQKMALNLKPDFTFENFIIGRSNQMAHAAAFASGQNPGHVYNPLFIYGGVGLGKTHLMQAIGHSIYTRDEAQNVLYISCERMFNEFIDALQRKTTTKFRDFYRSNVDVLLVDDIQFLSRKEAMQEEFFHTFNAFLQEGKQIVMTSDKSPQELQHIENRLVNRFEWGLVVDIQSPDFETRVAIIHKKLDRFGVQFDEDVCHYLANKVRNDVRKIEGALTRLLAYSSVQNTPVSLKFAKECLKDYVSSHTVSLDSIQKSVAEYFDIRLSDIRSHRRPKSIAHPRQLAMYLCRDLTNSSLAEIAQSFGGKDHTTVLYACRKITQLKSQDEVVEQQIEALKKRIMDSARTM